MVATGSRAQPDRRAGTTRHSGAGRPHRHAGRVAGVLAGALAVIGLTGACSVEDAVSFGWPKGGITPQSHRMFDLWVGSAVAALFVGFFVWGLIFWCILRYRKRGAELPAQTRYNLPIELIYTVVPFLIISVLFYYTAIVQTDVARVSDDPAPEVVVNIDASKWNWRFSYPGTNGPDGRPVYTVGASDYIPVLVLPTNRRIRFVVHSGDVIHSFWVPELLFKRDVFPGNIVNRFETTILQEGSYIGHCAELCGTYHFSMNFELRAVTPQRYQQFLASKQAGQSTPQALAAIGEEPLATTTSPMETRREAGR